jgi:RNA polymerase sigma-70 factor (ECF subfamily)
MRRSKAADARATLEVEAVYEAHFDFVWRVARRLGAPAQYLDDVVQEVFVVVQRRLPDFEGRSDLKTWLFGITRRIVRAHARRHARQPRACSDELATFADEGAPSAEAQLVDHEGTRVMYALLQELDENKRAVFVLSELEEMSGPAIAEALDLHLSNVYARIRTARQAFDAALSRYRARTQRQR